MPVGFSNYAATTITDVGGISAAAVAFTVASNAGMPSTLPFIARLTQYDANGDVTAYEFVRVTAQGGTGNRTWTITRAQESTVAVAHPQGTQVTNPLTAGVLNEDFIVIDSDTYYDTTFKRLSLGSNSLLPSYRFEVGGSEANNTPGAGVDSRVHIYNRDLGAAGRLAELTYGAAINSSYAAIDGYLQSAVGNTQGGIIIATRRLTADANLTEAMRIQYDGAVSIGGTAPSVRFEVKGPRWIPVAGYMPVVSIMSTDALGADVGAGLTLGGIYTATTPTDFAQISGLKETAVDGNYNGALVLYTRVHLGSLVERMRITSGGIVGINTSGAPTANTNLDVNGIIAIGNGAVGTPSLAFRGDLNTGLYWISADLFALTAGGAERMRVGTVGGQIQIGVGYAGGMLLGVGTEFTLNSGTAGSGLRTTIVRYAHDVSAANNIITDVYYNDIAGTPKRVAQLDIVCDGATDSGKWIFYTTPTGGAVTARLNIDSTGVVFPNGNKTQDLGKTGNRWSTIYASAALSTGTSRICDSIEQCETCQHPMKRGTGTLVILGEHEDYIPTFCPTCKATGFETVSHVTPNMLAKRKMTPEITLAGIKVSAVSGNSYQVRVDYIYGWNKQTKEQKKLGIAQDPIQNSTLLGQTEQTYFFSLQTNEERRAYLLELGRREWEALEESRLMEEEVARVQQRYNNAISELAGTNLLGVS